MRKTPLPAAPGRRKLAAIMFADMVSFSALTQRDEALALELVDEQRGILEPALPKFGGRLVKTMGDGYMVEFLSALEAVQCAIAIQRALAARNAEVPAERRVLLRVGIHLGDVVERDGDVFGDGVNIAARIETKAEPGGVCVSQQIFDQIQNKLKEALMPLGRVELKNIAEPLAIYKVELAAGAAPARAEAPKTAKNSVAVLPFVNMSSERENEYLSDGITEDIISALSCVGGLRVSARTSAFAFKETKEDVRRIGALLGAGWVVEGSVRKAGARLRITAQLVNVVDGFQLWSERYDREMRDVFAIQDEIARAVVDALKAQFKLGDQSPAGGARALTTTEAYELFLKGRAHWNQRGQGLRKARHYFELALLEDSTYGPAYAGLAETFALQYFYGGMRAADAAPRILRTAQAALRRDKTLAEAHSPLGFLSLACDRDAQAALEHLRHGLELNPSYAPARYWRATVYGALGRHDEARQEVDRALELDPLSPIVITLAGWLRIFAGRYDESAALLRKAISLSPNFMLPHWVLGQTLVAQGLHGEAIAELEKSVALSNRGAWAIGALGWVYGLSGRKDDARALLVELEKRAEGEYVSPLIIARLCLGLGDLEKTRAWLARAVEEKDSLLVWLSVDFAFDTLKTDAVCAALLERIALKGETE